MLELQQFSEQISIDEGTKATVLEMDNGSQENFIYANDDWIKFGNIHKVANVAELNELHFAQIGNVTNLVKDGQKSSLIYSGKEWLPLNSDEPITVKDFAELNKLPTKNGNIFSVINAENGQHEYFFYADDQWKKQIRGGDAGQIFINADKIQLTGDSEISTGSISGGGGSVIFNVNKLLYLTDSQISTSVQKGIGNGGNLTIKEPQFIVNGGNIQLASKQFITSTNSTINASSRLGLDGEVNIDSPDMDMEGFLVVLPDKVIDASSLFKTPCNQRLGENLSNFIVNPSEGSYSSPDDLLPSGLLLESLPVKQVTYVKNPGEKLAFSTCKN